jgi:transcriptional regulator NrdR family protein
MEPAERVKGYSFRCTSCDEFDTTVVDSRPAKLGALPVVRRRRKCRSCKARFSTYEIAVDQLEMLGITDPGPMESALRELEHAVLRLSALVRKSG